MKNSTVYLSTPDYKVTNDLMDNSWRNLFGTMGVKVYQSGEKKDMQEAKTHDLLLDCPVKK